MFAINRNTYLQCQSSSVNSRIINRCVDAARSQPVIRDSSYFEPPFFRLISQQPDIPTPNVDITRQPIAFGRWALPKLKLEIHNKDPANVVKALLSICDLMHDPERAYEALDLRIPDRLSNKLLDDLSSVREAAALALGILAQYYDGKEAIVANEDLMDNLILGLGDGQISVRLKIAACFEMMARAWMIADVLVDKGVLLKLLEIVEKDERPEIVGLHLETLKSLMYDCGKCIAIQNNAFKIFMNLLEHPVASIVCKALDCLMILTSTKKGKKLAEQKHLLKTLTRLIHYEAAEICKSATALIMFCTVKTRAKFVAADIKSLTKRLVKLTTNPLNTSLQMFAIKALTNICEHPLIRKEVCERYIDDLNNMQVMGSNAEYKRILLRTVGWVPETL